MRVRIRPKVNAATDVQTKNIVQQRHRVMFKDRLRITWLIFTVMLKGRVTCEDVLRRDLGLHFQRVLGGVRDLGAHVSHLTNKDRRQELGLLHTDQSCNTAVLEGQNKTLQKPTMIPGVRNLRHGGQNRHTSAQSLAHGNKTTVSCSFWVSDEGREEGDNPYFVLHNRESNSR